MGMKSHSNHFSSKGSGGPSTRNGNLVKANPSNYVKPKEMSKKGKDLYNKAQDSRLKNHIKELYRPGATIGDGGTADALREENKTGKLVGGKSHKQKTIERLSALKKLYNKGNLSVSDKKLIKELIDDLEDALKGGKK